MVGLGVIDALLGQARGRRRYLHGAWRWLIASSNGSSAPSTSLLATASSQASANASSLALIAARPPLRAPYNRFEKIVIGKIKRRLRG